jgi:outer membrane biosynthesis protein TonB
MSRSLARRTTWCVAAATLALTGSCSDDLPPDAAVPGLGKTLSRVDDSIANRSWDHARRQLQNLIAQSENAANTGTLTQQQADRIQAAVARLLSELPDPPAQPTPPSPTPQEPGTGSNSTDDEKEDDEAEEKEKRKEQRKEEREEAEDRKDEEDREPNEDDD